MFRVCIRPLSRSLTRSISTINVCGPLSMRPDRKKQRKPTSKYNVHNIQIRHNSLSHLSNEITHSIFNQCSTIGITSIGCIAMGMFGMMIRTRYEFAKSYEYLIKHGGGIFINKSNSDVSKRLFLLPFQTFTRISLEPFTFTCDVAVVMLEKKISFSVPIVFTIGLANFYDLRLVRMYASEILKYSTQNDLINKIMCDVQYTTRIECHKTKINDFFSNKFLILNLIREIDEIVKPFGLKIHRVNYENLEDIQDKEWIVNNSAHEPKLISHNCRPALMSLIPSSTCCEIKTNSCE